MKTLLLTGLSFLCVLGLTTAQAPSSPETNLTDQLKDLCDLTPDQVAKVEPLIADFEKKRDETYKKYKHNPTELKKKVKQNRWDYEVTMIGTLNPSQMGLLKVFDQRNTELMTRPSRHVNDVSYFASSDKTSAPVQSSPEPLVAVADNANEESSNQADLTGYIKELYNNTPVKVVSLEPIVPHLTDILKDVCNLSPEQVVEVQPIVASFEAKRDSIYKIYKNDDDNLNKQVRTNRLNYEVALLDVLSLDQMRTVRAFNLSNRELMAGSGTTVNKIEFLPEAPSAIVDAQPDIQPSASDKTTEVATSESTLTIELKDLCDLTPEQVAKAEPIIADFEKKRDETYKKYRHNPTELKKMVKQNRWDYEVAMIGTLNPSQMGLLKVFDQRNTELMTRPSTHIHDVKYFADAK